MQPERWTREGIVDDLRRIGVGAGDLLMVHASLRAVGTVEGDCLVTPTEPAVGVLAEVFRTRRPTRVSDHPEGRFVAGPAGPELRVAETLDDSDGVVEHPGEDYFATILRQYLATGRAMTGAVGGATSELIDADDIVRFAVVWMADHLVSR